MRKLLLLAVPVLALAVEPYKLGTVEMSGYFGASAQEGFTGAHAAFGPAGIVGLTKWLAVQGGYTYHRRVAEDASQFFDGVLGTVRVRGNLHELTVGPRLMLPLGRITPYVDGLAGMALFTVAGTGHLADFRLRFQDATRCAAFGAGAGAEVRFSRNGSFSIGVKSLKPTQMTWTHAVMFGMHYRVTSWRQGPDW